MALRQHRHTILYWPVMGAVHRSDWIRIKASRYHIMHRNP